MNKPHHHVLFAFAISLSLATAAVVVSARLFPTLPAGAPPASARDFFRNFTGCRRGDNRDGLSALKNYFRRFGYILHVPPPSNFSDDFDDALESAIKAYQLNFNLNVTGELDDRTLRQIALPRCGVADIINGTTAMNAGKANETTSFGNSNKPRFHTVSHYALFPGTPRWPEGTQELTYAFFPGNSLDGVVKSVFAAAFARWSEVTALTFRETASYYDADIRIGFFSGDHGDAEPFDGALGTLAHAFSPTNGRFHLDAAEEWVAAGDVADSPAAVDLESVAVHEIGHLLGLGHSSVEEAIMFPTISSRTKKVVLAEDDVRGIQYLYGSNPDYGGSFAGSSPETNSGSRRFTVVGSTWRLFVLLAYELSHLVV